MEWQRPETTRVYLHPPKAERLLTLWREGKVMLGEVEPPINQHYTKLSAAGVWFTDSMGKSADFHRSFYTVREDGIPVHKLTLRLGALDVTLECACDFVRCPSTYIKATVKAADGKAVSEKLGFVLRSGKECELIADSPDEYISYKPAFEAWYEMPSAWRKDGIFRDGAYFFTASEQVAWDAHCGRGFLEVSLDADEEKVFYFVLGKGEYVPHDFDTVQSETVAAWQRELARMTKLSDTFRANGAYARTVVNLTVQLLQCFCYGVGMNELYSRQGGLQRRVWTYEAMPVLEALARIGDFDDYIEPVIDVYFNTFYTESGEIVPLGIHWAMATGTVLNSFGRYALRRDKAYFLQYRDKAMKCFAWMRATRNSAAYDGAAAEREGGALEGTYLCVDGLFPPMSSCDDPLIFQAWLATDCNNLLGLKAFLDACEAYGDPQTDEVRAEYEEYLGVMRACWEKLKEEAGDTDELPVPFTPLGDVEEITKRFEFAPSTGFFVAALCLPPEDYEKILRYYQRRSLMRGGLYDRMPSRKRILPGYLMSDLNEDGLNNIWYVCAQEYSWFYCLMRHGEIDRCEEIVRDNLKYAITAEYYMQERYHQRDPWYAPWSPNASCNGRMINMLLDLDTYKK